MIATSFYPGRIIFDHLHKTAGSSVNAWLLESLGTGCVTQNLIGTHSDLIRQYGGLYSIICAHVHFHIEQEGLDLRYQYMTCLREPIDRFISWLYFVISNDGVDTHELKQIATRFIESDGLDIDNLLFGNVHYSYVEHFCRINGTGLESDDEKIANALSVIKQYDVVGLFEEMPQFLADVASLIGLPPPQSIAKINVTKRRPQVQQIKPALYERIMMLNQLDIRLYAEVVAWKASVRRSKPAQTHPLTESKWKKYEPVRERVVNTSDIVIGKVLLQEGYNICHGQVLTFDLDFLLASEIPDLVIGIHIHDSERRLIFGTNSKLLGKANPFLPAGSYQSNYQLVADLPSGKYTAGFAFNECLPVGSERELAWRDAMCEFQVYHPVSEAFVGSSFLPAEISLCFINTTTEYLFRADDSRLFTEVGVLVDNAMVSTGNAGYLIFGPYIALVAGQYQVVIHCKVGERGLAGAGMDIVADGGNCVFARCTIDMLENDGLLLVSPIMLTKSYSDIEIRVWVTDKTDLQIMTIEIKPWQQSRT
jgi:hypothetical protein